MTRGSRPVPGSGGKNQTLLIAGGAGGGALLLLIVIAVAASGGNEPPPPKPKPPVEQPKPKPVTQERSVSDTGAILFICGGSENHPDKEVILPLCLSCGAHDKFFHDSDVGAYRCQKCKAVYPNERITCPDCGRPPRRTTRIKHR